MRIYIAGPMSGYPDHNFPTFNEAAALLAQLGHEPVNPAATGLVDGWTWKDYLRLDVKLVANCDALALLPGWEASRGAGSRFKSRTPSSC